MADHGAADISMDSGEDSPAQKRARMAADSHPFSTLTISQQAGCDIVSKLEPKLRAKVWEALTRPFLSPQTLHSVCELSDDRASIRHVSQWVLATEIEESGDNALIRLCQTARLDRYDDFFEGLKGVTFMIPSVKALTKFCELMGSFLNHLGKKSVAGFTIHFPVFATADFPQASALRPYKIVFPYPHGRTENARGHWEQITRAILKLGGGINVVMDLRQPWRNFETMRFLTYPLRQAGDRLHVQITENPWVQVPDAADHLGVTVATLQGVKWKGVDNWDEIAERWVNHGTRGFRGPGRNSPEYRAPTP